MKRIHHFFNLIKLFYLIILKLITSVWILLLVSECLIYFELIFKLGHNLYLQLNYDITVLCFKESAWNPRFPSIRASVEGTCTVHLIGCVATAFISAGTSLILIEVVDCLMFCWTAGCYCRRGSLSLFLLLFSPLIVKRFIYRFRLRITYATTYNVHRTFPIELVVFYCINCCGRTLLFGYTYTGSDRSGKPRVFVFVVSYFFPLFLSLLSLSFC